MLILKIVALGPVHGYGISHRIRQISKEVLQVQQGSLYPSALASPSKNVAGSRAEWGRIRKGRQAKFYKLSAKGTQAARKRRIELESPGRCSSQYHANRAIGVNYVLWWKFLLFPSCASDAQMNSELRFHIDELTDENIAAGMPPDEARRRAILEFGGHEQLKEDLRDVYRIRLLDASVANLKSAFRFIRKSPTFSATVILTLALAICENSAVFSAIDAILLRPLPFPDAVQLMQLEQYNPKMSPARSVRSPPVRLSRIGTASSIPPFRRSRATIPKTSPETLRALFPKKLPGFPEVAPRFPCKYGESRLLSAGISLPKKQHFGGPNAV